MRTARKPLTTAIARALAPTGALALLALPLGARAADESPATEPIRVLVTGSNIPTSDRETPLPVQVITREDIERANFQTAAQLVSSISATMSYSGFNETQGLGVPAQAGFAGGALRGLGYQATLILLNGRRIATFAFSPLGGDLNAIPLSAVERVEVLKDGASAVYGADAVAGVINFILRKDYRGAEAYAQYTSPEHDGGYAKHFNVSAGYGDLATQGFNGYATIDYQAFGGIEARNRPFAARRYIPEALVDRTDVHTVPGNVVTPAGRRNPSGDPDSGYAAPQCAPPVSFAIASAPYECRWNGAGTSSIVDPSERINAVGAFTLQLARDHQAFFTGVYTRNRYTFVAEPTAVSALTSLHGNAFLLPATSPYYPHDFARTFGLDGAPLNVAWRAAELGPRTLEPTAEQWNLVGGLRGTASGWTYDAALNYTRSEVDTRAVDGYLLESRLFPLLNSGIANPFGANTPDVIERLSTAKFTGSMRTGTATTTEFDLIASTEGPAMPGGPLGIALGMDVRRDNLVQTSDPALDTGDIMNFPAQRSLSGSRDVWAVFAEASAPLLRSLELGLAVRYDHYSDFGSTTNPKVSIRWQPVQTVLLRASAGTGFFAPGLSGIYEPPVYGFAPDVANDPARCSTTGAPQDCQRHFPTRGGGNPDLGAVTSSQWSAGGVWSPTPGFSFGADYVSILLDDRINFFSVDQILRGCPDGVNGATCYLVHRGPPSAAFPGLPGPIVQIDALRTNLGKWKASAVDFSATAVAQDTGWGRLKLQFNGTYNIENRQQQLDGSYVNQIGQFSTAGGNPGALPRWHHYLMLDWTYGPWDVTLTENFQTGVRDQAPPLGIVAPDRTIGDYDVWNLRVAYAGFRRLTLSGGIKNLLDRDPPFSRQRQTEQVGYDPSYADPHGRLYWFGANFAFD